MTKEKINIKKLADEVAIELEDRLRKTKFSLSFGEAGVSCELESFGESSKQLQEVALDTFQKLNNRKRRRTPNYLG